jgi:hypothetical protein
MEVRRISRLNKLETTFVEAKEAQEKELNDIKLRKAEIAKTLNTEARNRVAVTTQKTKLFTEKIKEKNEAAVHDRTDAILELKTNLDASRAEVATLAEKHLNKIAAAEQRLENEKKELSTKGLNPYVEFRKKELKHEDTIKEEKIIKSIEKNTLELTKRIEKEENFIKKKEANVAASKESEKKHRENQGRHVIEEKNKKYIIEKTSEGVELLDPTGKLNRVDPSQITDIPDFSFGLGKSSRIPDKNIKKITENIRKKLNVEKDDLSEYKRLVNGLLKDTMQEMHKNKNKNSEYVDDNVDFNNEFKKEKNVSKNEKKEFELLADVSGTIPGKKK